MPLNFPTTGLVPNVTTYSYTGRTWIWNGTAWNSVGTEVGAQGITGTQGAQGPIGLGTQGATGAQGASGSNGTQGEVGTQGTTGTQGSTGATPSSGTSLLYGGSGTFTFTTPGTELFQDTGSVLSSTYKRYDAVFSWQSTTNNLIGGNIKPQIDGTNISSFNNFSYTRITQAIATSSVTSANGTYNQTNTATWGYPVSRSGTVRLTLNNVGANLWTYQMTTIGYHPGDTSMIWSTDNGSWSALANGLRFSLTNSGSASVNWNLNLWGFTA